MASTTNALQDCYDNLIAKVEDFLDDVAGLEAPAAVVARTLTWLENLLARLDSWGVDIRTSHGSLPLIENTPVGFIVRSILLEIDDGLSSPSHIISWFPLGQHNHEPPQHVPDSRETTNVRSISHSLSDLCDLVKPIRLVLATAHSTGPYEVLKSRIDEISAEHLRPSSQRLDGAQQRVIHLREMVDARGLTEDQPENKVDEVEVPPIDYLKGTRDFQSPRTLTSKKDLPTPPSNPGKDNPVQPTDSNQKMQFPVLDANAAAQPGLKGETKTMLWMGQLEPWIDENFVRNLWFQMGEQVSVKMIRDKFSGSNDGYCFVDFSSPQAATKALQLSGQPMPNSSRLFMLKWASKDVLADRRDDRGPEFSIFVGGLGPEVNEYVLLSLFQKYFPSCKSVKIMTDPLSGASRGYGFIRFSDEGDQQRALSEMQGVYCGNRPMHLSSATPKNKGGLTGGPGMGMPSAGLMGYGRGTPASFYGQQQQPQPLNQFTDPNNTTVFVGGLSGYVTEDELRSFFQGFGEITYVKIPPGKGCGFVQFVQRHAAELAINQMQGYPIGNSRVRLSWGRDQNISGPPGAPYQPAPSSSFYSSSSKGMAPSYPYSNYASTKFDWNSSGKRNNTDQT